MAITPVNNAEWPFRSVCYVEVTFPSGRVYSGSGVLVGPNDVLTAGHLVYDSANHAWASSVRVIPAYDTHSWTSPYGEFQSVRVQGFPGFDPNGDGRIVDGDGILATFGGSERDFGLITLNEAVGIRTGWMQIDVTNSAAVYNVTGFPASQGFQAVNASAYLTADRVDWFWDISSVGVTPGYSGGPVWHLTDAGATASVVGVVSTGIAAGQINPSYALIFDAWIAQNDAYIEIVRGTDSGDQLRAFNDNGERFFGDAGDDGIVGGAGADHVYGGAGDDWLYGLGGNDEIYGDDGADHIFGGNGDDLVYGGAGNDVLDGGLGADTLIGGAGNDLYVIGAGYAAPTIIDNDGFDTLQVAQDGLHTEFAEGTSVLQFTLADGVRTLWGNADGTIINGNAQDNVLHGMAGGDLIRGGDGNDTLYGFTDVRPAGSVDAAGDALYGDAGNDRLIGGGGADLLYGGSGDDWIEGEVGNGDATGVVAGNDQIFGEDGNDTVLAGGGDDFVDGGAGNDLLVGEWGNDQINGGDGNDLIDGRVGDDVLQGGAGNDVIFGDGTILIFGQGNDRIFGGDGDDILMGDDGARTVAGGNDYIEGGNGADLIDGGSGDDIILGGNGGDVILGGAGNDLIIGGAGGDVIGGSAWEGGTPGGDLLVYQSLADAGDLVFGFDTNRATVADGIDLRSLFASIGYNGGANARADGILQVYQSGADTAIDIDRDANGAAAPIRLLTLKDIQATVITDSYFLLA